MRHFQLPRFWLLLLVVLFVTTESLAKNGADGSRGGAASTSTSNGNTKSSGGGKLGLLSRFRKVKAEPAPRPPSLLERAQGMMTGDEYSALKPLWDRAVQQGWIHEYTGVPLNIDGKRRREEASVISTIMAGFDPYIERLDQILH